MVGIDVRAWHIHLRIVKLELYKEVFSMQGQTKLNVIVKKNHINTDLHDMHQIW